MIVRRNGMGSLRCDRCGKGYPRIAKLSELRSIARAARADGWRCFWGRPTSLSPDWPNGADGWRHACPSCVANYAGKMRERVY